MKKKSKLDSIPSSIYNRRFLFFEKKKSCARRFRKNGKRPRKEEDQKGLLIFGKKGFYTYRK